MEPRAVVADWSRFDDRLTLHLTTQAPHIVRTKLAEVLGMSEGRVRVVAGDVGGAFGSKLNVFPEEVLASLLSRHLGVPVRWVEDRSESAVSSPHGRAIVADVELAATPDGQLTGAHVRMVGDLGAHVGAVPATGPLMSCHLFSGAYRIPSISFEALGVFTNKAPVEPYRGYYRAEATFALERAMDVLAGDLSLDPVELRRRNLIAADDLPFTTATGEVYDTGDYAQTLEVALREIRYDDRRSEQRARRANGGPRLLGVGVATFVWRSSFPSMPGPTPRLELFVGGWDTTAVRVERTGGVTVRTGASPHGQGLANALATIVAERLDVDVTDVTVISGDTDATPYGIGSAGSRALVVAGSATALAAERVQHKAIELAAHLLEASPDDLEWRDRGVEVRGTPTRRFELYDLARVANQGGLPAGMEPGLEATASFDPENFTYPCGTHACVVEVDADTGEVRVVDYVAVDDCGRLISPRIVEGQVHGGVAQGIAQALLEEAVYDEHGQLLTGSFALYGIPSAAELPRFHVTQLETPTPRNPLGAKGAGEAGTIGAPAAVVNAVLDALSPLGVRHLDMPLTPRRVWEACAHRIMGSEGCAGSS
jgi:carbon-monoxide dehydrogenase large subunit